MTTEEPQVFDQGQQSPIRIPTRMAALSNADQRVLGAVLLRRSVALGEIERLVLAAGYSRTNAIEPALKSLVESGLISETVDEEGRTRYEVR